MAELCRRRAERSRQRLSERSRAVVPVTARQCDAEACFAMPGSARFLPNKLRSQHRAWVRLRPYMKSQAPRQPPYGRPFTSAVAAEFGRVGGTRSSPAKRRAARRNGRRGGRPAKGAGPLDRLRADPAAVGFPCPRCGEPKCKWRSVTESHAVCLTCGAILEPGPLGVAPRWLTNHEVSRDLDDQSNVAVKILGALVEIVTARPSRVRSKR